ncbi:MAG TPA: carbohydrate porin [Xanthobacteraceae bacterium]|nr:carbohydrate porin [Xanthobacteraceae bacterium]
MAGEETAGSGHRASGKRGRLSTIGLRLAAKFRLAVSTAAMVIACAGSAAAADSILVTKAPPAAIPSAYDWTGFYLGGNLGYAWGDSNWSTPGAAGSMSLAQKIDTFDEAGSFFAGIQGGYNYMLPNRWVIGGEFDVSAPSFQNLAGISVGGMTTFNSPFGSETYSETVLNSGTVRGRIGYAPGNWLFYATGGFAWTYDQLTLTNNVTGTTDMPFLWRLGWAAGAGVEAPVAPHWTARFEYLFTDYGTSGVLFAGNGQRFTSDFELQELRAGLNYQFGNDLTPAAVAAAAPELTDKDRLNVHGQTTFTWQGYPAIRAPYTGTNSLPGGGEGRETFDGTLAVGIRLWRGAELWVDPEIDQGHGLAETHGVAGFPSAESYKLGFSYPYARVQRYFVRQTIDLGGDSQKVDADFNQFAGSQTANRLVLTVGKFAIVDLFDTNKYANNPKIDFLNWASVNAGTFDYAGDAWGYTYGAAAEWYQGPWTLRGGVFDMSAVPAEAANSGPAYGLDPTFDQFQMVGEVERRYELWGQPGTIKVTGFLTRGRMATFADAIAFSQATGVDINDATDAVRKYQSRPGVSLNLAQQVTEDVGVFARAGWADGNVEPWDFTDIDRTLEAGVSITGKQWGRPDDTFGILGIINGINSAHTAWFNAGGNGILMGDGQLPNPGPEEIVETYYSYALTASTKVSVDYQFINNPAYATERGPVNVFAGRFHWQF